jgi:hypothetical protein
MAGFWLLLPWFPYRSLIQDAAMLALGSIGAVTSWAHNRLSLLDLMAAHNIVGLSHAARHLLAARKRATGANAGLSGAFDLASVDGTPDTLRMEGVEDQTTENRALVRKAAILFDLVRRDALPRVPSRALILEAAEQWKSQ